MDLNVMRKSHSKCMISLDIFKDDINIFTKEIVMHSINGILLNSSFLNGGLVLINIAFK